MRMKTVSLFLILLFVAAASLGQVADFDKSAHAYLDNLERTTTPALYAACRTQKGKAFVVFGLDGKQGMLFDLEGGRVVNSALLVIRDRDITIDVSETQGGVYTYTVMENYAKDLIKSPFDFVMPRNVKEIFKATPRRACVDKPPQYKSDGIK